MFININNVSLYYEIIGEGKPLIMLHGNGENHHIFDEAIDELKSKYKIYLIDSRGHGQSSEVQNYSYNDMCEDIYQFIKILKIKKPLLFGFSDGGIVALLLAIKYPKLLDKIIIAGANTNPNGISFSVRIMIRMLAFFKKKNRALFRLMIKEPHITNDMLALISIKTFIIVGENDIIRLSHTKDMANNIKDSVLLIEKDASHTSYVVNNKRIANIIIDFDLKKE